MTILYGLNAAGKSHILKALVDGMSAAGVLSIPPQKYGEVTKRGEVLIWIDPTTPEAFGPMTLGLESLAGSP